MPYPGWTRFGVEYGSPELDAPLVVNNELTRAIADQMGCSHLLHRPYCDTLLEAVGPVFAGDMTTTPWYDARYPEQSMRFYGVFGRGMGLVNNSTREVPTDQGITDGGVIGRTRHAMLEMRQRAVLLAQGRDALDWGLSWLDRRLDPDGCGKHITECGVATVEFLADCPPPRPEEMELDEYIETMVDPLRRYLLSAAVTGGPIVVSEWSRDGLWVVEVEWTYESELPFVVDLPNQVLSPDTPLDPSIVQDTLFNLTPFPSMELPGPLVTVATNYSTNPSVETDATGWATSFDGTNILTAAVSGARSTVLAAVGVASYRSVFTAPSGGSSGWFGAQQQVALPAGANRRMSVNMWLNAILSSGTAVLGTVEVHAIWRNGTTTVQTDLIGSGAAPGDAKSLASIDVPDSATNVIVRARVNLTSWSSGAVVHVYADALAVTVP